MGGLEFKLVPDLKGANPDSGRSAQKSVSQLQCHSQPSLSLYAKPEAAKFCNLSSGWGMTGYIRQITMRLVQMPSFSVLYLLKL